MKKNSLIRKWIKDNGNDGFVSFDFKENDILFFSPLVHFEYKVRMQRKRRKALIKDDLKVKSPACAFWFGSLDETIKYLQNTRDFLIELGYDTSQSIGSKEENGGKIYKHD